MIYGTHLFFILHQPSISFVSQFIERGQNTFFLLVFVESWCTVNHFLHNVPHMKVVIQPVDPDTMITIGRVRPSHLYLNSPWSIVAYNVPCKPALASLVIHICIANPFICPIVAGATKKIVPGQCKLLIETTLSEICITQNTWYQHF